MLINDIDRSDYSFFFTASCGNKNAMIIIDNDERVNVIVKNSSNRTWAGAGKFFCGKDTAISNYKSSEIKEIILTAFEFFYKNLNKAN